VETFLDPHDPLMRCYYCSVPATFAVQHYWKHEQYWGVCNGCHDRKNRDMVNRVLIKRYMMPTTITLKVIV
jgi:hypothetical protein